MPSFNNLRVWDRRLDSSADQYYILLKQAIQGTDYTVVPELWLEKKKDMNRSHTLQEVNRESFANEEKEEENEDKEVDINRSETAQHLCTRLISA